jgi:hypothetical protein
MTASIHRRRNPDVSAFRRSQTYELRTANIWLRRLRAPAANTGAVGLIASKSLFQRLLYPFADRPHRKQIHFVQSEARKIINQNPQLLCRQS